MTGSEAMTNNNAMNSHPQQNRRRAALLICLLIVMVGALAYWLYSKLEWEEQEIDHGYSTEARQNDYLAAEIFLRQHGIPATSVKNLKLLDQHRWRNIPLQQNDTIVLINAHKTLNQERYDSLYEWVENGGTLITSTHNPFIGAHTQEQDLLLRDFNIQPAAEDQTADLGESETDTDETLDEDAIEHNKEKEKENKPEQPDNYYRCDLANEPTEIVFADETQPLHFDFSRRAPFSYRAKAETEDETNPEEPEPATESNFVTEPHHLLYFEIGAGGITVTSDNSIWSNRRIDCRDHAYALWSLANHNGRVWFLINQDAPSLAAIIWRAAPYGVVAALLALALWLWAQSQRFGPAFVRQEIARRSLAEHIYASAMLLWRNHQHPQLLELLRQEILARLDEQQPQLDQAAGLTRIQFLHQLTGIAAQDIQQALFSGDLRQPQQFASAIAHLQTIRKQL